MSDHTDTDVDLSNPAPHDAILVSLASKDLTTLNDKELDEYISRIRELRGSAPTKRAAITPSAATKAKHIDLDKYL